MADTTKLEPEERKKAKRAARKAPQPRPSGPHRAASNKQKLKKLCRGQSKR